MMRLFSTIISLVALALRRIWKQWVLMFFLLVGLITAVGLLSSVPLYADAVQNRLLQGELTEAGTYRPSFAFMWRYIGAWNGDIVWQDYTPINEYLTRQAPGVIDLPVEQQIRHVATANLRLYPGADSGFSSDDPLMWVSVGFMTDLAEQITLVEGTFPAATNGLAEVLVSQKVAEEIGLQVGESYTLFGTGQDAPQVPVRISGIWQAADATAPYWFYQPDAFEEVLLTTEDSFVAQIAPLLDTPVSTAVWYQIYNGGRIRPASAPGLLQNIATVEARVTALLNNTTLDASPVTALQNFGSSSQQLTLILTVFSLPVIGLVLYFISLIGGMVIQRDQSEIAILRSRGMKRGQILSIYLLEGILIGGLGLAGGLALGVWLAQLMGRTRTFLDPAILNDNGQNLVPVISTTTWLYALLGVGIALLALLVPALWASHHTIVTLRWQQARALERPFWQRYYLDLFLLIPPLYGWYQLEQQGALTILGGGSDPFANPLLFLVPVLFCFALGLFLLRFFPMLLGLLARLAALLPGTTLLLTLRQLARSAALYTGPLLLLTLTVSLAVFTASMAVTFDRHLTDQVYYQTGADLNLTELGENTEEDENQQSLPGQPAAPTTADDDEDEPRWLFLPVTEHLLVPGVNQVARVGDYSARANIGGRQRQGRLLGVDRVDLTHVAYFRPDFANNESLGGLMNRLAVQRDNLLVSSDFMQRHSLQVGDPLLLTVGAAGDFAEVSFIIAAPIDLFPTQYPQDGPFFVGNLDYIHEGLGGTYPYNVWVNTDASIPSQMIVDGVRELGLFVVTAVDARQTILEAQTQPERQGLFGLLSVGFLAAAILTVLGFLVYAIVSFQRRFIQLGMLRAIGLSISQMAAYLIGEQAILILTGIGLGSTLGIWASTIFIPFLQVGDDKTARIPPFIVQIAWEQLGTILTLFGLMFVLAVLVLIALLIRMRVFEAVKLGETV